MSSRSHLELVGGLPSSVKTTGLPLELPIVGAAWLLGTSTRTESEATAGWDYRYCRSRWLALQVITRVVYRACRLSVFSQMLQRACQEKLKTLQIAMSNAASLGEPFPLVRAKAPSAKTFDSQLTQERRCNLFPFASRINSPKSPTISDSIHRDCPYLTFVSLAMLCVSLYRSCCLFCQVHLPCLVDRHNPALHRRLRTRQEPATRKARFLHNLMTSSCILCCLSSPLTCPTLEDTLSDPF